MITYFELYDPFNVISLAHKWIGRWNHLLSNCSITGTVNPLICTYLAPVPQAIFNLVKSLQWLWNLLILCKIKPSEKPILYSAGTGQAPRPPIIILRPFQPECIWICFPLLKLSHSWPPTMWLKYLLPQTHKFTMLFVPSYRNEVYELVIITA